jgi:chromosome segregation ATPase
MTKPAMRLVGDAPPRTPEREQLAEAIARRDTATQQLARIQAAHERAADTVYEAKDSVAKAIAALDAAKAGEGSYLAAVALGEADAALSPIKTAAAAVEEANDQLYTARHMRDALEAEIKSAERELMWAKSKLDEAVGEAVNADPATARLVAVFNEAERRFMSLRQAMGVVGTSRLPKGSEFWDCQHSWPELPDAAQWKAAFEALRTDADAPLPG